MIDALEWAASELTLFAAVGLLLGGIDDLVVDLIWIARALWRRLAVYTRFARASVARFAPPGTPGRIVVYVAAWQEAAVIGRMLRAALARFEHADYRIYVGCYPNDPASIAAVREVADGDARVRLAINLRDGPTTMLG